MSEKDLGVDKGGESSTDEPSNHYDDDFLDDEMKHDTAIFENIHIESCRSLTGIDSNDDFSDINRDDIQTHSIVH